MHGWSHHCRLCCAGNSPPELVQRNRVHAAGRGMRGHHSKQAPPFVTLRSCCTLPSALVSREQRHGTFFVEVFVSGRRATARQRPSGVHHGQCATACATGGGGAKGLSSQMRPGGTPVFLHTAEREPRTGTDTRCTQHAPAHKPAEPAWSGSRKHGVCHSLRRGAGAGAGAVACRR